MFQQVYFHKASRASEWMLTRILGRVRHLLLEGKHLSDVPQAIESIVNTGDATLDDYLALDDYGLWSSLRAWRDSSDEILSDLCRRIYARHLFKTHELFGAQTEPEHRERILEDARAIAAQAGFDPDIYVGLDVAADVPYDQRQDSLKVVFPNNVTRTVAEVSFLLGRLDGERLQRVRLLFPEELRTAILAHFGAGQAH